VYNRRYFEILVQKEAERSRRFNRDLAVVMIDVDQLKAYNDDFGRAAGDDALKIVARCIGGSARRGIDTVTRYGGQAFAVILPETNQQGALIVAENIRCQLRGERALLRSLTISLGIASMCGEKMDSQSLIRRAETALRQAKHDGGNRAVAYQELPPGDGAG
jgi:diguanylate cyclase (GGDEF)-like protein